MAVGIPQSFQQYGHTLGLRTVAEQPDERCAHRSRGAGQGLLQFRGDLASTGASLYGLQGDLPVLPGYHRGDKGRGSTLMIKTAQRGQCGSTNAVVRITSRGQDRVQTGRIRIRTQHAQQIRFEIRIRRRDTPVNFLDLPASRGIGREDVPENSRGPLVYALQNVQDEVTLPGPADARQAHQRVPLLVSVQLNQFAIYGHRLALLPDLRQPVGVSKVGVDRIHAGHLRILLDGRLKQCVEWPVTHQGNRAQSQIPDRCVLAFREPDDLWQASYIATLGERMDEHSLKFGGRGFGQSLAERNRGAFRPVLLKPEDRTGLEHRILVI